MAPASGEQDLDNVKDFRYRTLLVFLPGAGVLYVARDRRRKSKGVEGSRIPMDISWFRLKTSIQQPLSDFRLQFGEDGYVKRFASITSPPGSPPSTMVSAWRVLYHPASRLFPRELFKSTQCADHKGPRMPPNFVLGHDLGAWTNADRAQKYNRCLVNSNSMRVGGRHYAPGCLHLNIPDTCSIIDPMERPFIDMIVDIALTGSCAIARNLVIVVRSSYS